MKRQKLTVQKRDLLGKKVKKLRQEGILPANIYGKDVKSQAVQVEYKEFETLYKKVGETGLIDVEVDGKLLPVLIHKVQYQPASHAPLHIDFYQVNLKEKISTMVPLEVTGEPKAVTDKIGLLLQPLSEVEVEALPEELPEKIEVNVEHLAQVGDQITVADLKAPVNTTILTDSVQVVVKIDELISEEAKEVAAQMAKEAEAAKAVAAEAAPTEGEKPEEAKEAEQPSDTETKPVASESSVEVKAEKKE